MASSTGTQRWRGYRYVTDALNTEVGGVVHKCSGTAVTVIDQRNGGIHRIPQNRVRPMTQSQVEVYCSFPGPNEVPEQEQLKRRLEVQASWGPHEMANRRAGSGQ